MIKSRIKFIGITTRGGLSYKSDGDARLVASESCKLRILGCLGWKVTIFAHPGIA